MLKHTLQETTGTKIDGLDEACIQPNAVDLRVQKIERLKEDGVVELTEKGKVHMEAEEVLPVKDEKTGVEMYTLPKGYYRVTFKHKIQVGEHEAGWTIPRSTLTRNGVIIHSALYDAGYKGPMVAGMQVTTGTLRLESQTRIAQYICVDAETLCLYNGSYQTK